MKDPNARGAGTSTVRSEVADAWPEIGAGKVIAKHQIDYYCRPLWNWGRRTPVIARERRALLGFRKAGVHVPLVIDYRETVDGAELTTTVIPHALHLDQALARFPTERSRIMRNAGREIGKMHKARWTHGALYRMHILICPDHGFRVYLIDLEKARRSLKVRRDLARFERYNNYYLTEQDWVDFREGYALKSARPD